MTGGTPSIRWYRSFYFRLGFSFVAFVITLLIAQSVVFNWMLARPRFPLRSPNTIVAIVAADIGAALAQNPSLDVGAYLNAGYAGIQPTYVLMSDGTIVANRREALNPEIRRSVEGVLAGNERRRAGPEPTLTVPPFVMAPIQVSGALRGIVVLPPGPPPSALARDVGRLWSVPGTALLVLTTVLVAVFIFEPSRRRLKSLQHASRRLGAGDLSARAVVAGTDEIADVAATFNSMAADLAARDESLRTAERLRRQMLADVSHELRTPLTAMRGYVETLHMQDAAMDGATREKYFSTLERETVRLDRIVKDLLDLARFENAATTLEIRDFAVRRLFEHVVDRHQQEIRQQHLDVRLTVADAADQLAADPDRIEQVIENLFANALRHTPVGGIVELSAGTDDGRAVLAVANSGAGIDPDHIGYVFERFYKVDQARVNGAQGSGLGLSISKAIVEQHGGTIGVVSRPGWTVFSIALPHDHSPVAVHAYNSSTNL